MLPGALCFLKLMHHVAHAICVHLGHAPLLYHVQLLCGVCLWSTPHVLLAVCRQQCRKCQRVHAWLVFASWYGVLVECPLTAFSVFMHMLPC